MERRLFKTGLISELWSSVMHQTSLCGSVSRPTHHPGYSSSSNLLNFIPGRWWGAALTKNQMKGDRARRSLPPSGKNLLTEWISNSICVHNAMKGGRGSLSSIEKYLDRNPCAKQSFRKRWRDQVLISSKRNQAAEHTHIYARDFRYGARITRERSKIGARIDPGGRPPMPACPSKPSPKVLRTKRKSSILIIHRYSYNFLTHASPPLLPQLLFQSVLFFFFHPSFPPPTYFNREYRHVITRIGGGILIRTATSWEEVEVWVCACVWGTGSGIGLPISSSRHVALILW